MIIISGRETTLLYAGSDLGLSEKLFLGVLVFLMGIGFADRLMSLWSGEEVPLSSIATFGFFAMLFSIPLVNDFMRTRKLRRCYEAIANLVDYAEGGKVKFRRPLKARPILFLSGGGAYAPMGILYRSDTNVVPRGDYRNDLVYSFSGLDYGIAVGAKGEGMVALPGLEFAEPDLEDIVLLYVPSSQPRVDQGRWVFESQVGCRSIVEVAAGAGLRGRIYVEGMCRGTLYLAAKLTENPLVKAVKVKLVDVGYGESKNYYFRLAPQRQMFIVAHKKSSPRALAARIGRNIVAGSLPIYALLLRLGSGIRKVEKHAVLSVRKSA